MAANRKDGEVPSSERRIDSGASGGGGSRVAKPSAARRATTASVRRRESAASSLAAKRAGGCFGPLPPRIAYEAGFTLLELITVVAVISILVGIALPNYRVAIVQSREAVLKEDLYRLRDLIDQYYVDKGRYPASLETLVEDGYLRKVPVDPITQAADWEEVPAEPDPDNPTEIPGVYDVRSASPETSLSGTPYKEW